MCVCGGGGWCGWAHMCVGGHACVCVGVRVSNIPTDNSQMSDWVNEGTTKTTNNFVPDNIL